MTKKKGLGTKAKIIAEKDRERRTATAIFLAVILLVVAFSVYFTFPFSNLFQNQSISPAFSFKAAIVDQLSLTFPNQTFIETATNILETAGYTVDYYAGEQVTVDFYRTLFSRGYGLLILRAHSAPFEDGEQFFFTSQPYSKTQCVNEQLTDQVKIASPQMTVREFRSGSFPKYFAIGPKFVEQTSETKLGNATIIAMGCDGLTYTSMAEAFILKGAKAYIGWDGSVSADHTDTATTQLLQHIITANQTIKQAVDDTMKEVEADPAYESLLSYYPLEVGDYTIQNIVGS
jgi:hypothetical protein